MSKGFRSLILLLLLSSLHTTYLQSIDIQRNTCSRESSCSKCLNVAHYCGWCTHPSFNSTRCIPHLDEDTCIEYSSNTSYLQHLSSSLTILENYPLGSSRGNQIILTQPQRVKLELRLGETKSFNITSSPAPGYPLDLYLLMDLSTSMRVGFMQIQSVSQELVDTVRNITSDYMLGIGSFVDKPIAPFRDGSFGRIENPCGPRETCLPTYGFHHSLNLTQNFTLFNDTLFRQEFSRNQDNPEGTFDAIMQSAVCTNEIGWRPNSRHLILVVTDGTFHIAHDGKLAGIIEPNDGRCHLEYEGDDTFATYVESTKQDYPSIGHLGAKLQENNIFVIFAIGGAANQVHLYNILSRELGRSWVAKLEDRAENVLDIISDAYMSLSQNVNIELQQVPGVRITSTAQCDQVSPDGEDCVGINLGDQAQFRIDVTLEKCISQTAVGQINVLLYGKVGVEVDALCSCPCEAEAVENSPDCSDGNGTFVCGICECNAGRFGDICDCTGEAPQDVSACIKPGSNSVCSKRGQCVCGRCECDQRHDNNIYGRYCECSDTSCGRVNSMLCGGMERGTCACNQCQCRPEYSGSECECSLSKLKCIEPGGNGLVCAGRGTCNCEECLCQEGYLGEFCQYYTEASDCLDNVGCAECAVNSTISNLSDCRSVCANNHIPVKTANDVDFINNYTAGVCLREVPNCYFLYYVARDDNGIVLVGLVIGIILLVIIKVIFYYLEYREYKDWDKEVRDAIASKFVEAPKEFHKSVIQETTNPAFGLKNKQPLDISGYQVQSSGPPQNRYAPLQESTTM
ncbi:Integrin beta [Oopsacas minuta]|uniref:Integrin beta n=1 Tax=Oopsacas minuta TaxID=111878 RepID=A0AAV7JHT5_9METZ|nr:Integrin beta [Oopsacas minuta]